jgi:hypothetical protein
MLEYAAGCPRGPRLTGLRGCQYRTRRGLRRGFGQWWREQIKERGSLGAVYREVRRRQREYGNRDVG